MKTFFLPTFLSLWALCEGTDDLKFSLDRAMRRSMFFHGYPLNPQESPVVTGKLEKKEKTKYKEEEEDTHNIIFDTLGKVEHALVHAAENALRDEVTAIFGDFKREDPTTAKVALENKSRQTSPAFLKSPYSDRFEKSPVDERMVEILQVGFPF